MKHPSLTKQPGPLAHRGGPVLPDEDEEDVIYRWNTIQPALADQYTTDPGYTIADLREEVKAGDDGDDGVPPVYWQQFDADSMSSSGAYAGGGGAGGC